MFEYASALAGLGLFLSGLHLLSASMKPLAGKRMRKLLSKLAGGYASSAFAGTVLGGITQSTSGATFVCMGLVSSGALKFKRALTILAWSSVGGSLLVFLVSIDIRVAGMLLVGLVGIAHLFNADRIYQLKHLVAICFALGMLLLGLGMIKEGSYLLRESQWIRDFIEFSSETAAISFIIAIFFTLLTQSASTATVIGITLVLSGVIPYETALILVFGANVGSGLSLLFITSHLSGMQKQLSCYQFITKLSGVLFMMPLFFIFPDFFALPADDISESADLTEIALQISLIYLALQVSGALIVSVFQSRITDFLEQQFPESEEESLAKPRFIYIEAADDPDIAVSLAHKEQNRIIESLTAYLQPLRVGGYNPVSLEARYRANMLLLHEIKQFIDDVSRHEHAGTSMSSMMELQSRNELIVSLITSLNSFTHTVSETAHRQSGLCGSIIESLHLILSLMEETTSATENDDLLLELTSERSQLMDNIRNNLLSGTSENLHEKKSLFVSTRIFERILWQIRQILTSKSSENLV